MSIVVDLSLGEVGGVLGGDREIGEGIGRKRALMDCLSAPGATSLLGLSVIGELVNISMISIGINTVNSVPFPTVLLKVITPPNRSTKHFDTARPNPTPPYLRLWESSTWQKDLNIWG